MLLLLPPVHSGIFHSQCEQRLALLCLPRRDSCSLRFDYDAAAAGDDVGHSIADVGVVVVYLLRQRFSGFQFFSFFCAHEKCASLSYASGISSVSQSLGLSVCLAAAAAQAPSLNVLRCCSRVAKKNGTTQNSNSTSTSNSIAFGNFPCAQVALAKCVQRDSQHLSK